MAAILLRTFLSDRDFPGADSWSRDVERIGDPDWLDARNVGGSPDDVESRARTLSGGRRLTASTSQLRRLPHLPRLRDTVELKRYLTARQQEVDRALERFLPKAS